MSDEQKISKIADEADGQLWSAEQSLSLLGSKIHSYEIMVSAKYELTPADIKFIENVNKNDKSRLDRYKFFGYIIEEKSAPSEKIPRIGEEDGVVAVFSKPTSKAIDWETSLEVLKTERDFSGSIDPFATPPSSENT